ncbi:MAG: hypothetical protein K0U78_11740 [Actinomycetia bacterium]|nr:hypothetical protein [Actinomycetes bacterium]
MPHFGINLGPVDDGLSRGDSGGGGVVSGSVLTRSRTAVPTKMQVCNPAESTYRG